MIAGAAMGYMLGSSTASRASDGGGTDVAHHQQQDRDQ